MDSAPPPIRDSLSRSPLRQLDRPPKTVRRLGGSLGFALRLTAVGVVVLLLRQEHAWHLAQLSGAGPASIQLEDVVRFLPEAAALGAVMPETLGRRINNNHGQMIGWCLQTAPESDSVVGYSGSTNCLLVFDSDAILRGVSILESGDTRDHVADVRGNPNFLTAWQGKSWEEAAKLEVDTVSGATLTSMATIESIRARLGASQPSLRFPDAPSLEMARHYFPAAARLVSQPEPGRYFVVDVDARTLGSLLRTSPAADRIMGYQGPTDAVIVLDPDDTILGLWVAASFDNEPYVGYVRDETYFLELFNGMTLDELAATGADDPAVEGVSGATMTSQAIHAGLIAAAISATRPRTTLTSTLNVSARDIGTWAILAFALLICFTGLRGTKWLRIVFQLLLVLYFGLLNGDLISIALLTGWAQSGVPWRLAPGLSLLVAASLLIPIATKRQLYCHHVCPFGAAQQLVKGRLPWRVRIGRRWNMVLQAGPAILIGLALCIAMLHWPINLASLEPFDAFVFWVAGPVTLVIALFGLIASLFIPMAYCRYGCPTGAILSYVRRHGRSGRWNRSDTAAVGLVVLALVLRNL